MSKRPKRAKRIKEVCQHNWHYEHTVYQGEGRDPNNVGVHRQCRLCRVHQMAFTSAWVAKPKHRSVQNLVVEVVPFVSQPRTKKGA